MPIQYFGSCQKEKKIDAPKQPVSSKNGLLEREL